jgi:threonine dehydrogenase-like Zn-dependent dehydrogenase
MASGKCGRAQVTATSSSSELFGGRALLRRQDRWPAHRLGLDRAPDAYAHFDARDDGWTKVVLKIAA